MQTTHPMSETRETYTYCGITAPIALWNAVGLETIHWASGIIEFPRRKDYGGLSRVHGATDAELIEARLRSGDSGEGALVWLIQERRRQQEEAERTHAIYLQAESQRKAGDDAIHAARIHRQAEELRCKAAGIKVAY